MFVLGTKISEIIHNQYITPYISPHVIQYNYKFVEVFHKHVTCHAKLIGLHKLGPICSLTAQSFSAFTCC